MKIRDFQSSKLQESKILDSSQNSKRILKSRDFDSHQKHKVFETCKFLQTSKSKDFDSYQKYKIFEVSIK